MFHQTIVGKPKKCLNRNCRHPFVKESHLGYMVKSEIQVLAIMRCLKCKDTFAVVQLFSMAEEYKNSLPKDSLQSQVLGPISKNEINIMRKKLNSKDSLKGLYDGLKPNGSMVSEDDEES